MISPMAQKYAQAFINLFGPEISRDTINQLKKTITFFKDHRRALFLLTVPTIKPEVKRKGVKELCARFDLPAAPFIRLFDLLIEHRRGYFLLQVFEAIVVQYNKVHNIVTVLVESSCSLSDETKRELVSFAQGHFKGTKEFEFRVAPALIAGIKISSGALLWESSVQKYLRACARTHIC